MRFVHESLIGAPLEQVFAFHERPEALARLIPPWEKVEVLQPPTSLQPGTRVLLRMHLGPLRLIWEAEHTRYERNVLFQDVQRRGPFARWEHTHSFKEAPGGTLLRDEVEYALPLGPLGALFGGALVRRKLERMFAFRHQATRDALLGPA